MPVIGLLAVFGLVAANAFFVIAEYALVTSRRGPLEQRAAAGHVGAGVALKLMDDPVRLIGTVQIGITALGILLGAVGEPAIRELLGEGVPTWAAFVAGFLVTTYLSVAFGELVPKALALHDPEPIAAFVARPITFLGRLSAPAVWILQTSAALVLRPLGIPSVSAGDRPVSREDLLTIVQDAEEAGALGAEEEDMISAIVELRGRPVADVMVPWSAVTVADLSCPPEEVAADMARSNHSRLPAVASLGGPLVGVLHARDVWRAERAGAMDLQALARDAVVVPPTALVDAVLTRMRAERQHMAVVLDEYGSPVGIVTLEDVLEEIVGEIEDEFDRPAAGVQRLGEDGYRVPGALSLMDLERATGIRITAERAHSIGGTLQDRLGRVPAVGDAVVVDGVRLRAAAIDHHRVASVDVVPIADDDQTV
ncbi:hemolysin family protein [Paraconexibacter sp.]|uniref:hemolysin family protein n=1 Tax=Paraconexibacter sp. TaxID=2949640 RepID=UPI003568B7CA